MKVYVSSAMEDEEEAIKIAEYYENSGHTITRKWWLFKSNDPEEKKAFANMDKKAIRECDLFILYNSDYFTSGKYIELGMAIILEKLVFIYGKKLTTIFRHDCHYKGITIEGEKLK